MNYLIYEEDGKEPGRITQSNKVFDPKGYDTLLNDLGQKFVGIENPGHLNPELFIVRNGAPEKRIPMPIHVDRTRIKAGNTDKAIFTGIPINAKASVTTSGLDIGSAIIPDGEFELPIPVPCIYHVTITLWPYLDFNVDIEASQ